MHNKEYRKHIIEKEKIIQREIYKLFLQFWSQTKSVSMT